MHHGQLSVPSHMHIQFDPVALLSSQAKSRQRIFRNRPSMQPPMGIGHAGKGVCPFSSLAIGRNEEQIQPCQQRQTENQPQHGLLEPPSPCNAKERHPALPGYYTAKVPQMQQFLSRFSSHGFPLQQLLFSLRGCRGNSPDCNRIDRLCRSGGDFRFAKIIPCGFSARERSERKNRREFPKGGRIPPFALPGSR